MSDCTISYKKSLITDQVLELIQLLTCCGITVVGSISYSKSLFNL